MYRQTVAKLDVYKVQKVSMLQGEREDCVIAYDAIYSCSSVAYICLAI